MNYYNGNIAYHAVLVLLQYFTFFCFILYRDIGLY